MPAEPSRRPSSDDGIRRDLAKQGRLWVLSLIKPLFLRPGGSAIQGGLSRDTEPLLHMFADKVAEVVGGRM